MTPQISIASLQKIGSELAVAWSDSGESYVALEAMRRACPCASCVGEPDVMGRGDLPTVTYDPNSFDLRSWEIIGGYGLQPTWGDGHRTGIYSFPYLRKLGEQP